MSQSEALHGLCVAFAILAEEVEKSGGVTQARLRDRILGEVEAASDQAPERGDTRSDFRVLRHIARLLEPVDPQAPKPTLRLVH